MINRKITSLIFLMLFSSTSLATTLFSSDFEDGPNGMTSTGDWELGMPVGANGTDLGGFGGDEPVGGFSGTQAWGTVIGGLHNPSTTSVLTLAGLDLSNADTLTFVEYIESGSNSFDTAKVFVGATEVYFSDGNSGLDWRTVSIDLSSFTGSLDITWVFVTTAVVERVGWYLDDISVTGPSVQVNAPASVILLALALFGLKRRKV